MKHFGTGITDSSLAHPGRITAVMVGVTVVILLAAALPSLRLIEAMPPWVKQVSNSLDFLPTVTVDTDPENMLPADEPVRVFHREMKRRLSLNDIVVVGVVNENDPEGVFNPESLKKIYELTEFAKGLQFDEDGKVVRAVPDTVEPGEEPKLDDLDIDGLDGIEGLGDEPDGVEGLDGAGGEASGEGTPGVEQVQARTVRGVIAGDVIAPSTVDSVEPRGGAIVFSWLMNQPPATRAEALAIRARAARVPFLSGTLISDDGKAVAIYLPITDKHLSYKVYRALRERIAEFGEGPERFHITGLPVAEDTFGVEMFAQMAISAPSAMAVIFVLMLVFFRKLIVVISPMIVAMVSVIFTMGSLVIAGFPIHILSSMIPIFIMPIAVLDSIHIISEFFEKYQLTRDRAATMRAVMGELFMPMLYTSLTSAAGFASLALTPIPPVQVFGVFVAGGIMVAWLLTVTFIPAFVMLISPKRLENFGSTHHAAAGEDESHGLVGRMLNRMGGATYRRAKVILAAALVVLAVAGYGISRININDNPVKWFSEEHPIRVADKVLNAHFAGTYMAYLAMEYERPAFDPAAYAEEFAARAEAELGPRLGVAEQLGAAVGAAARGDADEEALLAAAAARVAQGLAASPGPAAGAWRNAAQFVAMRRLRHQAFKRPDVLNWQRGLQAALRETGLVGKSNSLADIVRTVHRDLLAESVDDPKIDQYDVIPADSGMVAECLLQFQSSHRYGDIDHFVTPDYETSSLWVQLTSGDNKDMETVVRAAERYIADNPPPVGLATRWFGLTYINVVWQDKMVAGMLEAFAGSFLVVFLLMTILFRSALWGLLSMIPLTVTIAAIYGMLGIVGKDYDMPVAVLSSLTLGLAVDFAIHFLSRSREMYRRYGSWRATAPHVFGEPARAIMRNIIVIAAGFTPLLLAPLVPYQTVGMFLATILLVSGVATLLILPALIRVFEKRLFRGETSVLAPSCNCGLCIIASVTAVVLLALNLYSKFGWGTMTWVSVGAVPVLALACGRLSRRAKCALAREQSQETKETDHASE